MPRNLALAFGELLVGGVILEAALKGDSLANVVKGTATSSGSGLSSVLSGASGSGTPTAASAAAPTGTVSSGSTGGKITASGLLGLTGATDPVPGATGSRLDQGADGTLSKGSFLAPFAGKVVYSSAADSGWAPKGSRGGGYVAIQDLADPSRVYYAAEGLIPTVSVGQVVKAGDVIAHPAVSPYNGILGNYEIGWANPASPGQPLAQVISNPTGMVDGFYEWLRSLGGPVATSTSDAGYS